MNIIVIGDGEVGKTSILRYFDKRKAPQAHIRTVGIDYITHQTSREGHDLQVKMWDTAGQERFRTLTYQFYKQADGIIVAFDLTNHVSFANVKMWISSIYKHLGAGTSLPKVLVGNKMDLIESTGDFVQSDAARALAAEHQMQYFEVSAIEGRNIDEMVNAVITAVYEVKLKPQLSDSTRAQTQEPIRLSTQPAQ